MDWAGEKMRNQVSLTLMQLLNHNFPCPFLRIKLFGRKKYEHFLAEKSEPKTSETKISRKVRLTNCNLSAPSSSLNHSWILRNSRGKYVRKKSKGKKKKRKSPTTWGKNRGTSNTPSNFFWKHFDIKLITDFGSSSGTLLTTKANLRPLWNETLNFCLRYSSNNWHLVLQFICSTGVLTLNSLRIVWMRSSLTPPHRVTKILQIRPPTWAHTCAKVCRVAPNS